MATWCSRGSVIEIRRHGFLRPNALLLEAERTAQLSVQQAQRQVQRLEALFKTGAISSKSSDDAQLKLDAAQANWLPPKPAARRRNSSWRAPA